MDLSQIEALEERLRRAMISSDVAELEELLAPDLVFTTFLGELISKADDIAAHKSGHLRIHSIAVTDLRISALSGVAIVTCRATIDASFDDDRTEQEFRFTRVWAPREDGAFQIAAAQATLVYSSLES